MTSPEDLRLNDESYINLLRKLISVADKVQNAPSLGLIPQEDLVSDFVLEELKPYLKQNGGPIEAQRIGFKDGRGHLILKYPGTTKADETINIVGSHMDVVPANPEGWERDPFELSVEGDKLYGRGTTDCLGHVALVAQLFAELAKNKVQTQKTVTAVLIASEENVEIAGVGVEALMETGKIDFLKNGPVLWVDCSDSQPCIGTAGMLMWSIKATGKLFHSGLPHLGMNALELAMDAVKVVQERFYKDFPNHEKEAPYKYACGSTLKPTRVEASTNGINQIPPWCTISGDVRLSPFYEMQDLRAKLKEYVDDLNANVTSLESRGPHSKYTLPKENLTSKLELTLGENALEGIACSLESIGFKSFDEATKHIKGVSEPFSIMGSLPLVRDLQRAGLDLTLAGFGKSSVYHGDNDCGANPTDQFEKIPVVAMAVSLLDVTLNEEAYISLLGKLISVSEKVQNAPGLGLIPQEDLVSDFVLEELKPYLKQNGGAIEAQRIGFKEGRGHLILKYAGKTKPDETINIVGSHMDVVPANPESWDRDPFSLTVEGDKLYGRGTTDCLGHVALVTQLFIELAKNKIETQKTVSAVLIASEENGEIAGVGVEVLMETGKIDFLKNGPVVWLDCSDSQPCIGTAGALTWSLKATGKLFHSGLPHLGMNALELAMDALQVIQKRFYEDFPSHKDEARYNFATGSTMKPTKIESSTNGINQIPPWTTISGDVRLSPFYEMQDLRAKLKEYVDDLNANITSLESRGPHSKYTLPKENLTSKLELTLADSALEGIACSLDSVGFKSFDEATKHVKGVSEPYAIMGSLPLVRDLQRAGLDLTLAGFGKSSVYHGDNEYCLLSDMKDGFRILNRFIHNVDTA
ncbi:unnamed protein product [Aphanomyces euteiches]